MTNFLHHNTNNASSPKPEDNSASYNSLAQSLIQNGILEAKINTAKNENPSTDNAIKNDNKKRLNEYDLELIQNKSTKNSANSAIDLKTAILLGILSRLITSKKSGGKFQNLIFKFFPVLKKLKSIQDSLSQLTSLNHNAKELLDKTVPYGESPARYKDLVNYLNCVNKLEAKLRNTKTK